MIQKYAVFPSQPTSNSTRMYQYKCLQFTAISQRDKSVSCVCNVMYITVCLTLGGHVISSMFKPMDLVDSTTLIQNWNNSVTIGWVAPWGWHLGFKSLSFQGHLEETFTYHSGMNLWQLCWAIKSSYIILSSLNFLLSSHFTVDVLELSCELWRIHLSCTVA